MNSNILTFISMAWGIIFFSAILAIPQYFLSKSKNKWFGLILPILSLITASVLSIILGFTRGFLGGNMAFGVLNISTIIYLTIYWYVRKGLVEKSEMRKMKIEDLE